MANNTFILKNITCEFEEELLWNGTYILFWVKASAPPHLMLSINGKVFSLSVNQKHIKLPLTGIIRNIKRTKQQVFFIETILPQQNSLESIATEIFSNYNGVQVNGNTCFSPIKDFYAKTLEINLANIDFIYQLLPVLEKNKNLSNIYSFNFPEANYSIPFYGKEDVNKAIARK